MYDPYCLSNEELVKKFMSICGRAGTANSGSVIDVAGPSLANDAHYFKGIVWSRMDNEIPPFRPGMSVRRKEEKEIIANSYAGRITTSIPLTIEEVHYSGNGNWRLVFKEDTSSKHYREPPKAFYNFTNFVLAP